MQAVPYEFDQHATFIEISNAFACLFGKTDIHFLA